MDELIERLHNAIGPDRELDLVIWQMMPEHSKNADKSSLVMQTPRYTGSLDAAMTLAEGLRGLSLHTRSNPDMGGRNWIVSAGSNRAAARSWPLALCMVGMQDRDKYAAATQS